MSDPDALSLDIGRVPASRRHRPPRRPPGRPGLRRRRQPSVRHRARGAGVVVGAGSHRRRSVVKVAYVRSRRAGAGRPQGAYLARDGAQRPGQRGLGFTASRDDLDLAATLGVWQAAGDARLWKAIISPEQGAELDLRVHARALVRQMEHDLGTRLEWVAIDHHNTDNPHVHLLIRAETITAASSRSTRATFSGASGIAARSLPRGCSASGRTTRSWPAVRAWWNARSSRSSTAACSRGRMRRAA